MSDQVPGISAPTPVPTESPGGDWLTQMHNQMSGGPAEPARVPSGHIQIVVKSDIRDMLNPDYLGSLITDPKITPEQIDRDLESCIGDMLAQDDLIEEQDALIGLRVSTLPRPVSGS